MLDAMYVMIVENEFKIITMEYFKKVLIQSKNDLPKLAGYYFAQHIRLGKNNYSFHPDLYKINDYVEDFDWYLLPVQLPTDEEIWQYAFERFPGYRDIPGTITDGCFIEGAKAMRDGTIEKLLKK